MPEDISPEKSDRVRVVEGPPKKIPKLSLSLSSFKMKKNKEAEHQNGLRKDGSELLSAETEKHQIDPALPYSGLDNLGNTCYINAVLQVLRYCPLFASGITDLSDEISNLQERSKSTKDKSQAVDDEDLHFNIVIHLNQLFKEMKKLEQAHAKEPKAELLSTKATTLIHNIRELYPIFDKYTQEDAHELLKCLLCGLQQAYEYMVHREKERAEHVQRQGPKLEEDSIGGDGPVETTTAAPCGENGVANGKNGETEKNAKKVSKMGTLQRMKKKLFGTNKQTNKQFKSPVVNGQEKNGQKPRNQQTLGLGKLKPIKLRQPSILSELGFSKKRHKNNSNNSSISNGSDASRIDGNIETGSHISSIGSSCPSPSISSSLDQHSLIGSVADTQSLANHTSDGEREPCFVEAMFQGSLVFLTRCLECETNSPSHEDFLDLSMPLCVLNQQLQEEEGDASSSTSSSSGGDESPLCLSSLFAEFTSVEKLTGDNKYSCDHCLRLTESQRTAKFSTLPKILTIHLKRFSNGWGSREAGVSKVSDPVRILESLSLQDWCDQSQPDRKQPTYQLFAVIIHRGSSVNSGHYLACVKTSDREKEGNQVWLLFDDESVTKLEGEAVISEVLCPPAISSSTSYILFYHQKDTGTESTSL